MANATFENTTGMLFLSTLITMGLWGAGSVQLYYYHNNCTNDLLLFKIYVFSIWIFDTVHQILLVVDVYLTFVRHFGDFEHLQTASPYSPWISLFGAFVAIMVQLVFLRRIWALSGRNLILNGSVLSLVMAQFIMQTVYFGLDLWDTQYDSRDLLNLSRAINSTTVAADCMIAGALVFLLRKSRTGFKRSDTIINRLTLFVIGTGLLTAISAILTLAMTLGYPDRYYYMLFFLNITRLYVNSLLAMLNYRKALSASFNATNETSDGSFAMTPFQARRIDVSMNSYLKRSMTSTHAVNINVMTETVRDDSDKGKDIDRDRHVTSESDSAFSITVQQKLEGPSGQ